MCRNIYKIVFLLRAVWRTASEARPKLTIATAVIALGNAKAGAQEANIGQAHRAIRVLCTFSSQSTRLPMPTTPMSVAG
jgi:hypothetical protein